MGGITGTTHVTNLIEERGAHEPEPLRTRPHGVDSDQPQQHVSGEIVAGGSDERREIDDRESRNTQVLPDATVGDGVAGRALSRGDGAQRALGEPCAHLDQQQDLADARRRKNEMLVDGEQALARRDIDHRDGDASPLVGQRVERPTGPTEARTSHLRQMARPTGGAVPSTPIPAEQALYQMVTRSSGASQRASSGPTSKAS